VKLHRMIERTLDKLRDHSPQAHERAKVLAGTLWQDDGTIGYRREHVNRLAAEMRKRK
jgi:hypothetical protein